MVCVQLQGGTGQKSRGRDVSFLVLSFSFRVIIYCRVPQISFREQAALYGSPELYILKHYLSVELMRSLYEYVSLSPNMPVNLYSYIPSTK